jgi:hypothetical protein
MQLSFERAGSIVLMLFVFSGADVC